jgi:methyltransferase (TIGR00027 family)
MENETVSMTALSVAVHRAVHQILENGNVFYDPLAYPILGDKADTYIAAWAAPEHQRMRLHTVVRARFAEDALASAVAQDITQVVTLGAGLDTFALRNPWSSLTVYEVDQPSIQQWKLACIRQAGLSVPAKTHFVSVDFETQALFERLSEAGFDHSAPAFFIWLGVTPYLTRQAISTTLNIVAAMPGSEVVFDYSEPFENYPQEQREQTAEIAQRAAAAGEPWITFFEPGEVKALLQAHGFDEVEDLGPSQIAARYFHHEIVDCVGAHLVRAKRN